MIEQALVRGRPNETFWDEEITGLHLRISGAGAKSFFLYYRTRGGIERRPKLGEYPEMSLASARKIAQELKARVCLGEDPKGEWNKLKDEMTIREAFELVLKEHWGGPRYQSSGWARQARYNFENHIDNAFGFKKLSNLSPVEVSAWHKAKFESPTAANRSLSVLSKIYSYAIEKALIPRDANPCFRVKPFKETKRRRFATPSELVTISRILDRESEKNPAAVAFIYLLMFTGARPSSIERAKRESVARIEHEGQTFGVLTFQGKSSADTGEAETVIIPPQAMTLLDKLPPKKTLTGIKMPKDFWNRIRKEAGCEDLWARDLRRTFATIGLSNGTSRGIIGELLNHKSEQTTMTYAKVLETEKIKATKTIADQIALTLKGVPDGF